MEVSVSATQPAQQCLTNVQSPLKTVNDHIKIPAPLNLRSEEPELKCLSDHHGKPPPPQIPPCSPSVPESPRRHIIPVLAPEAALQDGQGGENASVMFPPFQDPWFKPPLPDIESSPNYRKRTKKHIIFIAVLLVILTIAVVSVLVAITHSQEKGWCSV